MMKANGPQKDSIETSVKKTQNDCEEPKTLRLDLLVPHLAPEGSGNQDAIEKDLRETTDAPGTEHDGRVPSASEPTPKQSQVDEELEDQDGNYWKELKRHLQEASAKDAL